MKWRDDLRRVVIDGQRMVGASFRRVPFLVESVAQAGGRRVALHEFAFRDDPFAEDMGRQARRFKIEGYVIGDDYLAKKDALIAALEDEGPGEFVHPYGDLIIAVCETFTANENTAQGGWCRFSIDFVQTPTQAPAPAIEVDTASKVATSATAAATAADAQLAEDYDASGLPAFALTSAESAIKTAADFLGDKLGPAVQHVQELASMNGQLASIAARASSFAQQPASLLQQVRDAIGSIVTTIKESPGDVYDALVEAYSAALEAPVIGTTETRRREAENQSALVAALRSTIAIEAARLAPLISFPSLDDAIAARERVVALLDEQTQIAGDTAYPALVALRSDVMRAVPGTSALARVVTITVREPVPADVLSYRLYGTSDRADDIIARNNIADPGVVSGVLKVLSNGE